MTTGRVLWIIWCCAWAGCWLLAAWLLIGTIVLPLVCVPLSALSALAILLPVGKARRQHRE